MVLQEDFGNINLLKHSFLKKNIINIIMIFKIKFNKIQNKENILKNNFIKIMV